MDDQINKPQHESPALSESPLLNESPHPNELQVEATPESVADSLFNPGSIVLEKYLVIKLLGRGGMGSVYQVRDLQSRIEFALKYLNSQHSNDVVWRRFDNEARAANKLDHPNLIKVHDSGLLPDGQPYFVMDLVHGKTLADELKEKTRLPLERTLKIMIQVAFAMAYAHDNGVVHRDIKPSNIMIGNDKEIAEGNVKLVDFGIAKLTGKDTFSQLTLTRTGEIFGSPLYMSPEQCAGVATDHRSDLYSFGCVMYETLTGAPPILADNAFTTMMKHQNERPVPMKQASLGITFPSASENIVAKLLEKNPDQRYQSAHELVADLIALEQYIISGSSEPSVVLKASVKNSIKNAASGRNKFHLGQASAPAAVLILAAGFLIGFFTGRASNITEPTKQPAPQAEGLDNDEIFAQKNHEKLSNDLPVNRTFFSATGGLTRRFLFPQKSIGLIQMHLEPLQQAEDYFEVTNFTPMHFIASDYLFRNPHLITRFRSDELAHVELKSCDQNLLEILQGLVRMSSLRNLSLEGSSADESCLPLIEKMPNLISLNLTGARLSGAALARCKNLEKLQELICTQITNPKPLVAALKKMHALVLLDLSRTELDRSDLLAISKMKTLTHLDLTGDKAVDDKTLVYLATLPLLDFLDLEDCPITPKSIQTFQKMPNLHKLHLAPTGWSLAQQRELQSTMKPRCIVIFAQRTLDLRDALQ